MAAFSSTLLRTSCSELLAAGSPTPPWWVGCTGRARQRLGAQPPAHTPQPPAQFLRSAAASGAACARGGRHAGMPLIFLIGLVHWAWRSVLLFPSQACKLLPPVGTSPHLEHQGYHTGCEDCKEGVPERQAPPLLAGGSSHGWLGQSMLALPPSAFELLFLCTANSGSQTCRWL